MFPRMVISNNFGTKLWQSPHFKICSQIEVHLSISGYHKFRVLFYFVEVSGSIIDILTCCQRSAGPYESALLF